MDSPNRTIPPDSPSKQAKQPGPREPGYGMDGSLGTSTAPDDSDGARRTQN